MRSDANLQERQGGEATSTRYKGDGFGCGLQKAMLENRLSVED